MLRSLSRRLAFLPALALCLVLAGCEGEPGPPDPAPLVADLLSGDTQRSGDARLKLISMGGPAAPALAAVLQDGAPPEKALAATTLWGMGARAEAAVPALASALEDADPELRVTCAMALENMGPSARAAVPALTSALRDRERRVRQAAVKALGAIGPDAASALPALEREIKRQSWPEAEEAVRHIRAGP